jgi:hypothetical protein
MPGVTGREIVAGWVKGTTWGTANSVTRQILLTDTSGLDANISMIDDETFNQTFLGSAETGDQNPISQELTLQMRFEDVDSWIAHAMGSAAAPAVVSSQAANSLVAYSHAVTLATELTSFITLAVDMGGQYVLEVPSAKVKGYTIRVGENGRMMMSFGITGAKTNYTSARNTATTLSVARAAGTGNRALRKNSRFRMNVVAANNSLTTASDEQTIVREITFNTMRSMAEDDFVFNQDYIIEPEENGFPEFALDLTFARMNTVSANSLATAYQANTDFKADWYFVGPYINSTTQRSMLFEFPDLQLYSFRAPVTGADQVRPQATFRAKRAAVAPIGMSGLTLPFRLTIVNANSQNLLT